MKKKSTLNIILFIVLCISAVVFLIPIVFVLLNSFKGKLLDIQRQHRRLFAGGSCRQRQILVEKLKTV